MEEETEKEDGVFCIHTPSHRDRSPWLPVDRRELFHSPIQRRAYCENCGKVRYLGSARVKRLGYFVNLLNEVQKKLEVLRDRHMTDHQLTEVQKRLILKRLSKDEYFGDSFSNNLYNQYDFFKRALMDYTNIPEDLIDTVYQDFKG